MNFVLFADDTSTSLSGKNLSHIEDTYNTELQKVSHWLTANKLSLNVSKSNMILLRPQKAYVDRKLCIRINNEHILEKEHTKYLGIYLDNQLNWKFHMAHIKLKLE